MVERIRMLLETRQLTPTQFADAIGIARPIVSHILSGRNKPSLEVVQRILAAMPDLSMPWLLNGTGPMQADTAVAPLTPTPHQTASSVVNPETEPSVTQSRNRLVEPSLSASLAVAEPPVTSRSRQGPAPTKSTAARPGATSVTTQAIPKRFAPSSPKQVSPLALQPEAQSLPVAAPTAIPESPAANPESATALPVASATTAPNPIASALLTGGDKPIRRIVIFYRDGSFSDFQPEQL